MHISSIDFIQEKQVSMTHMMSHSSVMSNCSIEHDQLIESGEVRIVSWS